MRKVNKVKYWTALSSVALIFLAGIVLGQFIAEEGVRELMGAQANLRTYLLSLDLQRELASRYICDVNVFKLTEEKVRMGRELERLERRLGRDDPELKRLKEEYSLLSVRQWLLVERVNEDCDKNITMILFFYSNKENVSESESQGFVLDYLYQRNPNSVVIYAFDIDLENLVLGTIKEVYDVKVAPSLVIGGRVYSGFQSLERLKDILGL